MIITQTPLRISFLGGGTDYPAFFNKYGGTTLAVSIDKYTIITVHRLTRFSDCRYRIHYSKVESVNELNEIQHPSARECLRFLKIDGGIEIHYVSDLPARTGLGSSSSATVGLLGALYAFTGKKVSRKQIAGEAIYVEQEMIKENVGCQDQYACALGGFRHLEFLRDGDVIAHPVPVSKKRLQDLEKHLLLLYTGVQRYAHNVVKEQMEKTQSGENLKPLLSLKSLVEKGKGILTGDGKLHEFGLLLHEGWMLKRQLSSKISNLWIDELYERARKSGAIGGKILGAGSGGFLLLYVETEQRDRVRRALPELKEVEFAFEKYGSKVIFHRP